MTRLRVFVLALSGFALPVGLAWLLAPLVFNTSYENHERYERARFGAESTTEQLAQALPGSIDPNSSYVVVPSSVDLDPQLGKTFVVSFLVRFKSFPAIGKRSKIIFKYAAAVPPYQGWAVAWRNLSTSLRPEIYWQDVTGSGGWFSFERVPMRLDTWYSVTFFADSERSLSLYVDEVPSGPGASNVEAETASTLLTRERIKAVHFAGGYSLESLGVPRTDDSLHIRAGDTNPSEVNVDVAEVVVGQAERAPGSITEVQRLIAGGFLPLREYLGEQGVSLWIDRSGKDLSSFHRDINSSKVL